MLKSRLKALLQDYDKNRFSLAKENERITLLRKFLTSSEMAFFDDSDDISFDQFALFVRRNNKDPDKLFSKDYFQNKSKSKSLFQEFKFEAYQLPDVNFVLKLLSIFFKDKKANKVAMYVTDQFSDIDYKTADELNDVIEKISQWIKEKEFLQSIIGTVTFISVLEKSLAIFKTTMSERNDPENIFNKRFISLEIEGKRERTLRLDELLILGEDYLNKQKYKLNPQLRPINTPSTEQIQKFINILIHRPITIPITLNFSECKLQTSEVNLLAKYLESNKTTKKLTLWLYDAGINDKGVEYFAELIKSGNTSEHLFINLEKNYITDAGIQKIADAIKSGYAKTGLSFSFEKNIPDLSDQAIKMLADSIQSGFAPPQLSIMLSGVSDVGVSYLAEAIKSGKAPKDLNLWMGDISNDASKILVQAVASGKAPEGMSLNLFLSPVNPMSEEIENLLTSGNAPKRLKLYPKITDPNCCDQFGNLLIQALKKGYAPEGLEISFSAIWSFSQETKSNLIDLIGSGVYPTGFRMEDPYWLMGDKECQQKLAAVLMKSTDVFFTPDSFFESLKMNNSNDVESLRIIEYCSLRNKLLLAFPEFAHVIKKISMEAGLFEPGGGKEAVAPTLKSLAAHSLLRTKETLPSLPEELLEYLKQLKTIQEQLADSNKRVGVSKQKL